MPEPDNEFSLPGTVRIDFAELDGFEYAISSPLRKKNLKRKKGKTVYSWRMIRFWGSRDEDDDDGHIQCDCGWIFNYGEWGWQRVDEDRGHVDYVCKKCRGVDHDKAIANDGGED